MPSQAVQNLVNSESFGAAGRYRLKKGYFALPAAREMESFHSLSQFSTTLAMERTLLKRVGIGSEGGEEKSKLCAFVFARLRASVSYCTCCTVYVYVRSCAGKGGGKL